MTRAVKEITQRLLTKAGIRAGQRILDVGCGGGALTFIAAEMLAGTGTIVGIDRDTKPLAIAEEKRRALNLHNVSFIEGDLIPARIASHERFDVVMGRRVLMYQPDTVAAVKQVASVLKPGGILAFQEHDANNATDLAIHRPLHARARQWIWETVRHEGGDTAIGLNLHHVLRSAGLGDIEVRAEANLLISEVETHIPDIFEVMVDRIMAADVATREELQPEVTIKALKREHHLATQSSIWDMAFLGWARVPD